MNNSNNLSSQNNNNSIEDIPPSQLDQNMDEEYDEEVELKFQDNKKVSAIQQQQQQQLTYIYISNFKVKSIFLNDNSPLISVNNYNFFVIQSIRIQETELSSGMLFFGNEIEYVIFQDITIEQVQSTQKYSTAICLEGIPYFKFSNSSLSKMCNVQLLRSIQLNNNLSYLLQEQLNSKIMIITDVLISDVEIDVLLNIQQSVYLSLNSISLQNISFTSHLFHLSAQKIMITNSLISKVTQIDDQLNNTVSTNSIPIIKLFNSKNTTIKGSNFSQIISPYSQCLRMSDIIHLTISYSQFSQLYSQYSSFHIHKINNSQINDSAFLNNTASEYSGGAIYLNQSNVSIQNSQFLYNSANKGRGGAIYLDSSIMTLENSKILFNFAIIGGGISYFPQESILITNNSHIEDNTGLFYGNDIGIYPKQLKVYHPEKDIYSEKIKILDYRSGTYLKDSLNICFVDDSDIENSMIQKSIQIERDSYSIDIKSQNNDNSELIQISQSQFNLTNNCFLLKFRAAFSSISEHQLFISSNKFPLNINNANNTLYFPLSLEVKDCIVGEQKNLFFKMTICEECRLGTYSFADPVIHSNTICLPCPDSAVSCIKNIIHLKDGYWRSSDYSDDIIKCQSLGCSEMHGDHNKCIKGYIGPVCSSCQFNQNEFQEQFGKQNKYKCIICEDFWIEYVWLAGSFLMSIIYMKWSITNQIMSRIQQVKIQTLRQLRFLNISKSYYNMGQENQLFKQLFTYLQILSSLFGISSTIPENIKQICFFLTNPIWVTIFSFDCIHKFPNLFPLYIWRIIGQFFLLLLIYLACFYLQRQISKQYNLKRSSSLMAGLVVYTYHFPFISSQLLSLIICQKLDTNYYLQNDLQFECFTQDHLVWSILFIYPVTIIWMIILPIKIIRQILIYISIVSPIFYLEKLSNSNTSIQTIHFNNAQKPFNMDYIFTFEVFSLGYIRKYPFWEIEKMYLLVMITIFASMDFTELLKYQLISVFSFVYLVGIKIQSSRSHLKQFSLELVTAYFVLFSSILLAIANLIEMTNSSTALILIYFCISANFFIILIIVLFYYHTKFKPQKQQIKFKSLELLYISSIFNNKVRLMKVSKLWKIAIQFTNIISSGDQSASLSSSSLRLGNLQKYAFSDTNHTNNNNNNNAMTISYQPKQISPKVNNKVFSLKPSLSLSIINQNSSRLLEASQDKNELSQSFRYQNDDSIIQTQFIQQEIQLTKLQN